jgi:hypothetical protein
MSDKMETGRGQLGGSLEHLEGKGGQSDVAIPRFLCGSPHLGRLMAEGWFSWASIERTDRMLVIWAQ